MTAPRGPILVEAAIDSATDAERAVREGANRLEVCANLNAGGLTPTAGLIKECLALGVPCIAMARPRSGHFVYGPDQMKQVHDAVKLVCDAGATGVVFGVLADDHVIDARVVRDIVNLCGDRETVFHRAFDSTPYARKALETLIACEVTRVLTSGQAATATQGIPVIKALVEQSAGRIEILPAGTVRGENVIEFVERTGVTQVHARASEAGVIEGIRAALSS